jgi:hypothetical protein
MAIDRKISDLDNVPVLYKTDYLLVAREDFNNYKISYEEFFTKAGKDGLIPFVVYQTGDQLISGVKTFDSFIIGNVRGNVTGNLSGTASYVLNGVYELVTKP